MMFLLLSPEAERRVRRPENENSRDLNANFVYAFDVFLSLGDTKMSANSSWIRTHNNRDVLRSYFNLRFSTCWPRRCRKLRSFKEKLLWVQTGIIYWESQSVQDFRIVKVVFVSCACYYRVSVIDSCGEYELTKIQLNFFQGFGVLNSWLVQKGAHSAGIILATS